MTLKPIKDKFGDWITGTFGVLIIAGLMGAISFENRLATVQAKVTQLEKMDTKIDSNTAKINQINLSVREILTILKERK